MTESATAAPTSEAGASSPDASEVQSPPVVDAAQAAEVAKQERLSKAFLQAQRKQSEALSLQKQLAAERESLARERAEIEAHRAKVEKFRNAADPTELLDELGIDYMELTRRIADADTPEGKIKYLEAAIRKQQEEFKSYLDGQKAERERLEKETKSQREQGEWAQAVSQFTDHVLANEDTYPHLSLYPPERIAAAAKAVAEGEFERVHGRPHRDGHEIAKYLEELASREVSGLEERKAKRTAKASNLSTTGASQAQPSPTGTSKLGTLTNKSAASTAAPSPSTAPTTLEERKSAFLARIKAAKQTGRSD